MRDDLPARVIHSTWTCAHAVDFAIGCHQVTHGRLKYRVRKRVHGSQGREMWLIYGPTGIIPDRRPR